MHTGISRLVVFGILAGCQGLAPTPESSAAPASRLFAALPLRNLAGDVDAAVRIRFGLQQGLEGHGVSFVPDHELEQVLRRHRIRYTDSMSQKAVRLIARDTGADHLLLGTMLHYDPGPDPRLGVSARILDVADGNRLRSTTVSLQGSDFEGLLKIGAITDMAELELEVLAQLVSALDLHAATPLGQGTRPGNGLVYEYRREGFHLTDLPRIAILPPENRSKMPFAGELFAETLMDVWYRGTGVQVVERSELLAALVREKIRSMGGLDRPVLVRLGRSLGTRYFVRTILNRFAEKVAVDRWWVPEIEASLHVLDVDTGQIVAAAAIRRRGDDYFHLLGLGMEHDPIRLMQRVAQELLLVLGDPQ